MAEINLYNIDCMEFMRGVPDKYYDLAIVDPPYGINAFQGTNRASRKKFADKKDNWDSEIPSEEYFKELMRVSKDQIIWGGNYFLVYIKNCRCYLIWDKLNPDRCFADCEFAWTSFDEVSRIIKLRPQQENKKDNGKIHPTQKPVNLYKRCLQYAAEGAKILDTHLGSGSIAIACHDLEFSLDACEISEDYYNAASERLRKHKAQTKLFTNGDYERTNTQLEL